MNYFKHPSEDWKDIGYKKEENALPCPCCGNKADLVIGCNRFWGIYLLSTYVQCSYCGVKSKPYLIDKENIGNTLKDNRDEAFKSALEYWNTEGAIYEGEIYGR